MKQVGVTVKHSAGLKDATRRVAHAAAAAEQAEMEARRRVQADAAAAAAVVGKPVPMSAPAAEVVARGTTAKHDPPEQVYTRPPTAAYINDTAIAGGSRGGGSRGSAWRRAVDRNMSSSNNNNSSSNSNNRNDNNNSATGAVVPPRRQYAPLEVVVRPVMGGGAGIRPPPHSQYNHVVDRAEHSAARAQLLELISQHAVGRCTS
jgi:hypothetical protein